LEKPGISAVIITFNEISSIERCLSSINGIADEIIVVDSFSEDFTKEICRKYNARFISHEFTGFMDQKNYSLTLAAYDYILSLDADEALSPELHDSLAEVKNNLVSDGYLFNRLGIFCGQWIRHSAWYPDRQLRLFKKNMGEWGTMNVHEKFIMTPGSRSPGLKEICFTGLAILPRIFQPRSDPILRLPRGNFSKRGRKLQLLHRQYTTSGGFSLHTSCTLDFLMAGMDG